MISYDASGLQGPVNTLPDSIDMPVGISGADNKIIGERTEISDVQHDNVLCLLLRSNFSSQTCYVFRFQKGTNLLL